MQNTSQITTVGAILKPLNIGMLSCVLYWPGHVREVVARCPACRRPALIGLGQAACNQRMHTMVVSDKGPHLGKRPENSAGLHRMLRAIYMMAVPDKARTRLQRRGTGMRRAAPDSIRPQKKLCLWLGRCLLGVPWVSFLFPPRRLCASTRAYTAWHCTHCRAVNVHTALNSIDKARRCAGVQKHRWRMGR